MSGSFVQDARVFLREDAETSPEHGARLLCRGEGIKKRHPSEEGVARVTGLEPATSGVTGRRSNQLSYTRSLSLF